MINKVKDYLGIEGVRLTLPEDAVLVQRKEGLLTGVLSVASLRPQAITALEIVLTERYSRGRGDEQLIDTYELGRLEEEVSLRVAADECLELPFELSFAERLSPIEALGRKNRVLRPFTALARKVNKSSNSYSLVATAKVQGVALSPTVRLDLTLG